MSKSGRYGLVAFATLAAGLVVWRERPRGEADPSLIDGRVWVDLRPDRPTDYVHGVIFMTDANFGLFQRGSAYDVRFELFEMTRVATSVDLTFPQSNREAKFTFAVHECTERKPFDLCLSLSSNPWDGPTEYFGFSRPEEEQHELGALSRSVRAAAQESPRPD